MRLTVCTLALAASAGTALGQCNVYKYGVPDFDQRRSYLPGDGAMYCVPTSILNWMGYIANRGQPQAMGHSSANWASMNEYAQVNVRDYNMGGWMGTSATGGTGMGGTLEGAVDYMDHYGVGPAIMVGYIADEDWQVTPKMMHDCLKMGWLVSMIHGRYLKDGNQWERSGAHCVSLCAVNDACNPSAARVGFKDPNTGDSILEQAPFATSWWDITRQMRNFDGDVYHQWGPAGQSGNSHRYIDKVVVIMPLFVLTSPPFTSSAMLKCQVNLLNNDDTPPSTLVNMPQGALLLGAQTDPRTLHGIVITAPVGGTPARAWDYNAADDTFTAILDLPGTPGAFVLDKRGDLLMEINGDIYKYRYLGDGSVRALGIAEVGLDLDSLAVDDKTDDLYALAGAARRLLKFPGGDLAAVPYNGPIAANVPLGPTPCIAVNPAEGKPWVCSEGSTSIYQLTPLATAPGWTMSSAVQTGAGSQPKHLQFGDHGEMKFISQDTIKEWEIDPASGRYVLSGDPHFDNLPASRFLSLARSRSNFDPRVHVGPAWNNLENPELDPAEVPDCPADFNGDGFVDGIDYDEFNNLFERGHLNADVNFDGFVDGIDYDSFNNWFEKGG